MLSWINCSSYHSCIMIFGSCRGTGRCATSLSSLRLINTFAWSPETTARSGTWSNMSIAIAAYQQHLKFTAYVLQFTRMEYYSLVSNEMLLFDRWTGQEPLPMPMTKHTTQLSMPKIYYYTFSTWQSPGGASWIYKYIWCVSRLWLWRYGRWSNGRVFTFTPFEFNNTFGPRAQIGWELTVRETSECASCARWSTKHFVAAAQQTELQQKLGNEKTNGSSMMEFCRWPNGSPMFWMLHAEHHVIASVGMAGGYAMNLMCNQRTFEVNCFEMGCLSS